MATFKHNKKVDKSWSGQIFYENWMYSNLIQALGKIFSKYTRKVMFMNIYVTFTDHVNITFTTHLFCSKYTQKIMFILF